MHTFTLIFVHTHMFVSILAHTLTHMHTHNVIDVIYTRQIFSIFDGGWSVFVCIFPAQKC